MIDHQKFGHSIKGIATTVKRIDERISSIEDMANSVKSDLKFIHEFMDEIHKEIYQQQQEG